MRLAWIIFGLVTTYIVQVSFFGAAHIFGVVPNLLLVAFILLVPVLAPEEVVATGIGIGLLMDLSSGTDFGLRTAIFVMTGLALLLLRSNGIDSERPTMAAVILLGAVVTYNVVGASGLVVVGAAPAWWRFLSDCLAEYGLCLVALFPLRAWSRWLRPDTGTTVLRRWYK